MLGSKKKLKSNSRTMKLSVKNCKYFNLLFLSHKTFKHCLTSLHGTLQGGGRGGGGGKAEGERGIF